MYSVVPASPAIAFLLLLFSAPAPHQKPDPLMGTRTLNVAKSTFDQGAAPKSRTARFESFDGGIRVTVKGINGDGKPLDMKYTARFDGQDYPVSGAGQWDALSMKRLDQFTFEQARKKGGQVLNTARFVVSPDGKVLTVTETGADGKQIDKLVFEK